MSDTPIFDQLARELGYNRLVSGGPTLRMRPRVFKTVEQTDETVNAAPMPVEGDEVIVYRKPFPVTTLADLAEGTHQE